MRRYLAKDMPNLECKVTRANHWRADGEPLRVVGGLWRSRIVLKRGDGVLRMRLTLKCGEGQPGGKLELHTADYVMVMGLPLSLTAFVSWVTGIACPRRYTSASQDIHDYRYLRK